MEAGRLVFFIIICILSLFALLWLIKKIVEKNVLKKSSILKKAKDIGTCSDEEIYKLLEKHSHIENSIEELTDDKSSLAQIIPPTDLNDCIEFDDLNINCGYDLTQEQKVFIQIALQKKNILVEACIGSGKTTSIQVLCDQFPQDEKIVYLTYNRLLKHDAQKRILNKNVIVNNYHGFAYTYLKKAGISCGVEDLIYEFNKELPSTPAIDVLLIDEYQDIDQDLANMLQILKERNPSMQIIAVGDIDQKIYDKTALDVKEFISSFLGSYTTLTFTNCFRLNNEFASKLGRIWNKKIVGTNNNCTVEHVSFDKAVEVLSNVDPQDVLCLGSRNGLMTTLLNELEDRYPDLYNKNTVYASIRDEDRLNFSLSDKKCAIFTTFDSSKGLERKICVVFDFTEDFWNYRKKFNKYSILKNIFCVAASRGKERVLFVDNGKPRLSEKTLQGCYELDTNLNVSMGISTMFDDSYIEDIEACYELLEIKNIRIPSQDVKIEAYSHDGLIDLSPCLGIYQEASFFSEYDIDKQIEFTIMSNKKEQSFYSSEISNASIDKKILYLASLETGQKRYFNQVRIDWISDQTKMEIRERLGTVFFEGERVQVDCGILFQKDENGKDRFVSRGFADVVKENTVYELKFVSELSHKHVLQCACYMYALKIPRGILWNIKTNEMKQICFKKDELSNKYTAKKFMDRVAYAVTRRRYSSFIGRRLSLSEAIVSIRNQSIIKELDIPGAISKKPEPIIEKILHTKMDNSKMINYYLDQDNLQSKENSSKIVIIDTETNDDRKVMSIGLVIADKNTFQPIGCKYYIVYPEYRRPAMYSYSLDCDRIKKIRLGQFQEIIEEINQLLLRENIISAFVYNASFDAPHLRELNVEWLDIMRIAAYKQFNKAITDEMECYKTGRLKRGYGAENILRLLQKDGNYEEIHNALTDAEDELKIMQLLGYPYDFYKSFAQYKL